MVPSRERREERYSLIAPVCFVMTMIICLKEGSSNTQYYLQQPPTKRKEANTKHKLGSWICSLLLLLGESGAGK